MHCITIHDVPDSTYQALSERARQHGRGVEDEVRVLLEGLERAPEPDVKLGTWLAGIGREIRLTDEEVELFNNIRSKESARARSGNALLEVCQTMGLSDEEHQVFDTIRDRTPAKAVSFE